MNSPVTPPSLSPEERVPAPDPPGADTANSLKSQQPWGERIFQGDDGLRTGWRILLYLGIAAAMFYLTQLLGTLLFPELTHGTTTLWQALYQEFSLFLSALLPAFLMGHVEERPFDDYGLPRSQAFGKLFWTGAGWGFVSIAALLLLMRGAGVFHFGDVTLHGARIWRFALFWGLYFVMVGLFEEFLTRGYLLFSISRSLGFWPAAGMLSFAFGAIHLMNAGEGVVGAFSAAFIGLFFCLTLRRTGTLWFAVGFHAAWDWAQSYVWGVADSGTNQPGHLMSPSIHGSPWLTGGSVGPEGSVLCFVLVVAVWALFTLRYPQVKYKG
jgi:uncharacterized protein